jgi:hypothetical protein
MIVQIQRRIIHWISRLAIVHIFPKEYMEGRLNKGCTGQHSDRRVSDSFQFGGIDFLGLFRGKKEV